MIRPIFDTGEVLFLTPPSATEAMRVKNFLELVNSAATIEQVTFYYDIVLNCFVVSPEREENDYCPQMVMGIGFDSGQD